MRYPRAPTLGVVAISYNEQRDLPGFLANLLPWVDEIVIVDDGSTDSTPELAAEAADKVVLLVSPREAGEYFSHQRNKGIDAARSDWLLHMDIDERVPPKLAQEICKAIRREEMDAYRYRRLNFFLHRPMRGGGWQRWNLVHLARREVFRFGGMYHEDCLVDAPRERIGQLENPMWHLNDADYGERMGKSLRYIEVEAESILAKRKGGAWWHLVFPPLKEFLKKYLVLAGYRDGVPGLLFAIHSACAVFKAHALAWDRLHPLARKELESQMEALWESQPGLVLREQQIPELEE